MTKDEFIYYVKGIIDREEQINESGQLYPTLKLIKSALETITNNEPDTIFTLKVDNDMPDMIPYSSVCSCNPELGGSGICGCTLGNNMIPNPKKYGNFILNHTKTNS